MATPAEPILASEIGHSRVNDTSNAKSPLGMPPSRPRRLRFENKTLDSAFEGGLGYQSVHCIVSEPDNGASELVHALIASHLRSFLEARATVIDSTLSFDVRRLFTILGDGEAGKDGAMKMLGRLDIMKVFDYVGLTEAVAELRDVLEGKQESGQPNLQPAAKTFPSTIEDSEEDEDEMLDDIPPAGNEKPQPAPALADTAEEQPAVRLLIVNNISQLMMPQVKNNYTHGQALIATFMRSLQHLTQSHNICTVLLSNTANKPAKDDEKLSLFKSCALRPALGLGFGYLVDVQTYLHKLPIKRQSTELAHVLEIVQDRESGRFGRWAAFTCDADGRLRDLP
ncbi:Hypothetical predicted protein [Lecanosticta acicola]|uniref:DNA recombination and repair protein Rad51-like C-terminal domain-containing protein n=1 Tax=Lecanosticta acicola TaxID=111012 RepID=A0AAI9ECY0_9PEZI|nr:Hypothetical predicted protein [Lecanosticta acicola]